MNLSHTPNSDAKTALRSLPLESPTESTEAVLTLPVNEYNYSNGVISLELGRNKAFTSEQLDRLKIRVPQIRVNYYPGPIPLVATGYDPLRYYHHGDVNEVVEAEYVEMMRQLFPSCADEFLNSAVAGLKDQQVAGFLDSKDFSVRIEDRTQQRANKAENFNIKDRAAMAALVEKYRIAIAIADHEARKTGGKVFIEPLGNFGMMIAKMLYELPRVNQSNQYGAQFIRNSSLPLPQGRFFCSKAGTRFKSLGLFRKDLFSPLPPTNPKAPDLPPRYEDRTTCHAFLKSLAQFVDPSVRNDSGRGRREAQFLLIDPGSRFINESVSLAQKISKDILNLADTLASQFPDQCAWADNLSIVRTQIENFIQSLEKQTDPIVHRDDFNNLEYVQIVAQCLRGDANQLEFGDDVHTPHIPLKAGRLITDENGNRSWQPDPDATPEVGNLVEHVFKVFPEALHADWFCVLKPTEPLTHDHHHHTFVKTLGDEPDDSYLVCFGRPGEQETREVFRRDPFSEASWLRRDTERVRSLLQEFTPEELTSIVHLLKKWQSTLYNQVGQSTDNQDDESGDPDFLPIPDFELHDDYLNRPLIDGKRIDLLNRGTMPFEQISAILRELAPIAVTNFIAQRPVLLQRELLMGAFKPKSATPSFLRSIGISDSFSDALGTEGKGSSYERNGVTLYGTLVASWIASYLHGSHAIDLTDHEKGAATEALLNVWTDSFTTAYLNVQRTGFSTDEVRSEYSSMKATLAEHGRELPKEFDITRNLHISEHLATKQPSEITLFANSIRTEAMSELKTYGDWLIPPDAITPSQETTQSLIETITALRVNHSATTRLKTVKKLLCSNLPHFAQFQLQHRDSLLSLANVCLWLSEISGKTDSIDYGTRHQRASVLYKAALDPRNSNQDIFADVVAGLQPALYLPRSSAKRFYTSIQGLHALWFSTTDDTTRKLLNDAVMEASGTLMRFRATIPVLEDTLIGSNGTPVIDFLELKMPDQKQSPTSHP
jgi:hypothetical protein